MTNSTKRSIFGRRAAILAGTAIMLASTAMAYAADAGDANQTETVIVTGTRIPRPELDLPNPTTSLSGAEIEHSGATNLTDYLKRIPALVGSMGDYQTNGYATPITDAGSSLGGLDLLDLRNLGYIRTLVLIDGKRSVSQSTGTAAVDINTIPLTLISDIQVSTGGASAVYGADGVSGVVNFVMKHDLDGVHTRFQAGTSEDGGGSKFLAAASVGHNFDDGKGNVTFTFEGTFQDHLNFTQRSFTRTGGISYFVSNPANLDGSNAALPANIPTNDAAFIFSARTGAIDTDLDGFPDTLGDGQPFNLGTNVGNNSAIGSSGTPYAEDLQGDFQPTTYRAVAEADGHYDFNRYFQLSGSFKYVHISTKSVSTAPFDDITAILPDNAFLPATVSAAITANGQGFGTLAEDYQSIRNGETDIRDTYRFVGELKGDLPNPDFLDNFKYDISYVYGQTDVDDIADNNRITDRFFAALDSINVNGQAVCRSNVTPGAVPPDLTLYDNFVGETIFGPVFSDLTSVGPGSYPQTFTPGPNSGCVAFNPFGVNAASQAARNFVTMNTHDFGAVTQHVLTGFMSADIPAFQSWGLAGPLSAVLGGEYRKETSSSNPDAIEQGNDAWLSGILPVRGQFDVYEFFAELSQPILKDLPFAKEVSIDGAVRQSHYSTAGDSTSWKFGGIWAPTDWLKLRGTDAVAVRAPNIGELFAPVQSEQSFVTDPCDATQVGLGTPFRAANCQAIEDALLGPGNYQAGVTNLLTGQTTPTLVGGNTHLGPETARTFTYGVVFQPSDWVPGLAVTVDWYDVKITNAIEAPSGQLIAQQCVDLSTIVNPFCAAVTRTPGTQVPGAISSISAQEINVASFGTGGVDFTLDYHADTNDWVGADDGTLDFHLVGNWLDHLTFVSLAGQAPVQGAGDSSGGFEGNPAPRWQTNLDILWKLKDWSVDYNIDWYSHTLRSSIQTFQDQPNVYAPQYLYLPDRFVQSIQVGYDVDDKVNLYGGIENLFYQKPAIGTSAYPVDPIGRFFYVGIKFDGDLADVLP